MSVPQSKFGASLSDLRDSSKLSTSLSLVRFHFLFQLSFFLSFFLFLPAHLAPVRLKPQLKLRCARPPTTRAFHFRSVSQPNLFGGLIHCSIRTGLGAIRPLDQWLEKSERRREHRIPSSTGFGFQQFGRYQYRFSGLAEAKVM